MATYPFPKRFDLLLILRSVPPAEAVARQALERAGRPPTNSTRAHIGQRFRRAFLALGENVKSIDELPVGLSPHPEIVSELPAALSPSFSTARIRRCAASQADASGRALDSNRQALAGSE
jgi:hypothetical protein